MTHGHRHALVGAMLIGAAALVAYLAYESFENGLSDNPLSNLISQITGTASNAQDASYSFFQPMEDAVDNFLGIFGIGQTCEGCGIVGNGHGVSGSF